MIVFKIIKQRQKKLIKTFNFAPKLLLVYVAEPSMSRQQIFFVTIVWKFWRF